MARAVRNYLFVIYAIGLPLSAAWAATIPPSPSLYAATGSPSVCTEADIEVPSATTATASATSCSMDPTAGTASFTGFATATYTSLNGSASMTLNGAGFASQQTYSSYARTIDNLDIQSNGNSAAYISLGIAIDGDWSNSGLSFVKPVFTFGFDYGDTSNPSASFIQTKLPASNGSVDTVFWTPFYPISDFENYDYFFSLSLQIFAPAGSNVTASGVLNFADTAQLQFVDVKAANGSFIPNVTVTSDGLQATGQTNVTFTDVGAPEPSTLGLAVFAGIALVLWRCVASADI